MNLTPRVEMKKKSLYNRSAPLVIPKKNDKSATAEFKVYDEPVIVKAGTPIMVSDETKEIFKLSKEIFE